MKKTANLIFLIRFTLLALLHVFANGTRHERLREINAPELQETRFEVKYNTENENRRFTCYPFTSRPAGGNWDVDSKQLSDECIALFDNDYLVKNDAQGLNIRNTDSFGIFLKETQEKLKLNLRRFDSNLDTKLESIFQQWAEEVKLWTQYVNKLMEKSANGELDTVSRSEERHPPHFSVYYDPSKLTVKYVSLEKSLDFQRFRNEFSIFSEDYGEVKKLLKLISTYDNLYRYYFKNLFLFLKQEHCNKVNSFYDVVIVELAVEPSQYLSYLSNPETDKSFLLFSSTDLPLLIKKDKQLQCYAYEGNRSWKKKLMMQEHLNWMNKKEETVRKSLIRIYSYLHKFVFMNSDKHPVGNLKSTEAFFADSFIEKKVHVIEALYERLNERAIDISNTDFMVQVDEAMEVLKNILASGRFGELNSSGSDTPPITITLNKNDVLRIKWKMIFSWGILPQFQVHQDALSHENFEGIETMIRIYTQLQAIYIKRRTLELWKELCSSHKKN